MTLKTDMHEFLCALPKCEHHIHIEGSLSPTLLFSLSAKNNIPLPQDDPAFESIESLEKRYTQFTDLQDFLNYYYLAMSTLIHASDFEDLMYAYLVRAVSDGLVHAEIFFDPQAHTERGVALQTVVDGLRAGIQRAQKQLDVSADIIMCFLRHLPPDSALSTFHDAQALNLFHDSSSLDHGKAADTTGSAAAGAAAAPATAESKIIGIAESKIIGIAEPKIIGIAEPKIIGIGLDSAELPFPPQLFEKVYALASKAGLYKTAHAGEEGPAAYIATSLDTLHVTRIDHGINLVQDEALLQRIAHQGVLLSVCPLSNVCLRAVESVAHVPIRRFLEAGVKFSINSDDPAYFGGYILDNYLAVQEAHHLSMAEWIVIAKNGIEGSWCSRARKEDLLQKLETITARFNQ